MQRLQALGLSNGKVQKGIHINYAKKEAQDGRVYTEGQNLALIVFYTNISLPCNSESYGTYPTLHPPSDLNS